MRGNVPYYYIPAPLSVELRGLAAIYRRRCRGKLHFDTAAEAKAALKTVAPVDGWRKVHVRQCPCCERWQLVVMKPGATATKRRPLRQRGQTTNSL